jgi:hypothetical protein
MPPIYPANATLHFVVFQPSIHKLKFKSKPFAKTHATHSFFYLRFA